MDDATTLAGYRLPADTREAIETGVESLLARHQDALVGASIVVLPDAHYPYHPSTGLVTNPATVAATVAELQSLWGTEVVIGCRSSSVIDTDAAARILGYHRLADRLDTEVVDLDGAATSRSQVRLPDGPVAVDLPAPMADATVVPVPTLRTAPELGFAAGMVALARAALGDALSADRIWAVVSLCESAVTILDGTYTYPGEPRSTGFLLSGDDVVALDASLAGALGQQPSYLSSETVRESNETTTIEGVSLPAVLGTVASDGAPRDGEPGQLMRMGYRLYARLSGDAVPPQLLP